MQAKRCLNKQKQAVLTKNSIQFLYNSMNKIVNNKNISTKDDKV